MVTRLSTIWSPQKGHAKYTTWALCAMLTLFGVLVAPLHGYAFDTLAVAFGIGTMIIGDFLLVQHGYTKIRFITFVIASLFYSLAFWMNTAGIQNWWLPVLLFSTGIVILLLILPQVEAYVFSTSLIGVVLLGLFWAAAEWWLQSRDLCALLALLGAAILFVTALTLAVRKERAVFLSRTPFVVVGYLSSQLLFTLSVLL
jgi:uncharacterized membrane protein YhhN